ncbi:MAG TPA: HAD hydrolase-like protein, partial [Thermodesulfobacteriota bacterium]
LGDLGGFAPREVVHVGDDPVLDVLGARNAGLKAVHFTPARSPEWAAWALPPHRQPDLRETPAPDATLVRLADLPALLAGL